MTHEPLPVNRDFKGIWIPKEIWLDPNLSMQAKALWAEIDSLYCEKRGGCYASDDYLMKFLQVKISRFHEVMKELKDACLIEKVSFDGRVRVVKAIDPKEAALKRETVKQPSGKPEPCITENRNPELQETGTLPYIRDISLEKSLDNPPIPPLEEAATPHAAKAADEIDKSSSKPKRARTPSEFSPTVKQLAEKMVNALHQSNPDWLIPKNLYHVMTQLHEMITNEKREPSRILDVFMWAINDHFWAKNLAKPNPVKYLREKFGQLARAMDAKPAPKERKFAASSNDKAAIEKMEEMTKRAL